MLVGVTSCIHTPNHTIAGIVTSSLLVSCECIGHVSCVTGDTFASSPDWISRWLSRTTTTRHCSVRGGEGERLFYITPLCAIPTILRASTVSAGIHLSPPRSTIPASFLRFLPPALFLCEPCGPSPGVLSDGYQFCTTFSDTYSTDLKADTPLNWQWCGSSTRRVLFASLKSRW